MSDSEKAIKDISQPENDRGRKFKVVVEQHPDGYVAYPLGVKGVVVGQGDSYEEALADIRSAIRFHLETFGEDAFEDEDPVISAALVEIGV